MAHFDNGCSSLQTFQACAVIYTLLTTGIHTSGSTGGVPGVFAATLNGVLTADGPQQAQQQAPLHPPLQQQHQQQVSQQALPHRPTVKRPLILCPSSLVSNWGNELTKWLEGRVEPLLMDDTKGAV